MRKALLALALLGVAVLAARWLRGRDEAVAVVSAPEPAIEATEPAVDIVLASEPAREASAPLAEEQAPAVTEPEPVVSEGVDEHIAPAIELSGTFTVTDEDGVEHCAEDGRFQLAVWSGKRAPWHEVEVRDGRWETTLPVGAVVEALSIASVQLGGRPTVAEASVARRFPIPESRRIDLRARWPAESLLHVRDRETGQDLAPVLLVEALDWRESALGHPGAKASSARDLGPSPVLIPPSDRPAQVKRTLWVRSPGHAWGRIEIEANLGGERQILLDAESGLEVIVQGAVSDEGSRLRVFEGADRPLFDARLVEGISPVDAIPAGSYRIRAEIGDWWDEPLVLAETEAVIAPGGLAQVTLRLRAAPEGRMVPLAGVLVLPSEWGVDEFVLLLDLLDPPLGGWPGHTLISSEDMSVVADDEDTYRWSVSEVQTGRHAAHLLEIPFIQTLDVGESGLETARLEVPPPADLRVRCVEAETGLDAEDAQLIVTVFGPSDFGSGGSTSLTRDADRACWIGRAPVGRVELMQVAGAYAWESRSLQVLPGVNEHVLEVHRRTGVELVLRDGPTVIPWDDQWPYAKLVAAAEQDNRAQDGSWGVGGGRLAVYKRAPGRYTLSLPEIPGYEPVPDVEVTLVKGVVLEHVVELRRAR